MAPIKVYTQSPINAAKASGITPSTAAPDDGDDKASERPVEMISPDQKNVRNRP